LRHARGRRPGRSDDGLARDADRRAGEFKGSAEIDIAEIRGVFDGNLTVREKLVIYSTGKVTGKIRYGKVVIEEGGQLSGEISFGTKPSLQSAA
jgi:cytoskeletal protein CcmA (bactofilin family)